MKATFCWHTLMAILLVASTSANGAPPSTSEVTDPSQLPQERVAKKMEKATFGGGCFWCTEAVYQQLRGVDRVVSGYTGGITENPTYEQVCTGRTGHAEAIEIEFDPAMVSYDKLVEIHLRTHDPTTLNRQGADTGTQYRSAIFYHDAKQKEIATAVKDRLEKSGIFDRPIVTEISPAQVYYAAEKYHQNYYNANPSNRYCTMIVREKVEKVRKLFKDDLKEAVPKK